MYNLLQVRTVAAKYIMKCDDDTFVRLDAVVKEVKKAREDKSLYLGNINYNFKPFRRGKWAVTYEVPVFGRVPCFFLIKVSSQSNFSFFSNFSATIILPSK